MQLILLAEEYRQMVGFGSNLKTILDAKKRDRFQIMQGDCALLLKDIESVSIDLVVTSPPYDDLRDYNGYAFDFEAIAKELARVLRPGGVIVWIVADATVDGSETGTSFRQALYFKDECGLNIHDTMIWNKGTSPFPMSNRYNPVSEYMFVFSKGTPKTANIIKDKPNVHAGAFLHGTNRQRSGETTRHHAHGAGKQVQEFGARHNVWEIPNPGKAGMLHPATFPFRLAHDHILSWSLENQVVLDPFCGSGTTGKAALKLNRYFIGMEISEDYAAIANRRILGMSQRKLQQVEAYGEA
jgi:DNA modification methylase